MITASRQLSLAKVTSAIDFASPESVLDKTERRSATFKECWLKKRIIMEMFSTPAGSLVPPILIVYQELLISCFIPSVTELIISSFCMSGLVNVTFRGIVFMIARIRRSFSTL